MEIIHSFWCLTIVTLWIDLTHGYYSPTTNNDYATLFFNKTDPNVYNKWMPPLTYDGPIRINVSIFHFGSAQIYDSKSEFHMDLLLRISWLDTRLSSDLYNATILQGGLWHLNRIWIPTLHIVNGHEPNILQNPIEHPVMVRIASNGLVLLSKRILLEGNDKMDFRFYPFDIQQVKFVVESNEITIDQMRLHWSDDRPYSYSNDFTWNGFKLVKYELSELNVTYTKTGVYSRVMAVFFLERKFHQMMLDVYAPISLFVIVSWGSFWVEITGAPARVTLGVTVMLTMVTTARSAREKLPKVPYVHALDVWILACIVFVFASIVEYVAVNYIYYAGTRYQLKRRRRLSTAIEELQNEEHCQSRYNNHIKPTKRLRIALHRLVKPSTGTLFPQPGNTKNRKKLRLLTSNQRWAYSIDRLCRFIFPITFICFNLVYWSVLYAWSRRYESNPDMIS